MMFLSFKNSAQVSRTHSSITWLHQFPVRKCGRFFLCLKCRAATGDGESRQRRPVFSSANQTITERETACSFSPQNFSFEFSSDSSHLLACCPRKWFPRQTCGPIRYPVAIFPFPLHRGSRELAHATSPPLAPFYDPPLLRCAHARDTTRLDPRPARAFMENSNSSTTTRRSKFYAANRSTHLFRVYVYFLYVYEEMKG